MPKPHRSAYVFAMLPSGSPVLAGKINVGRVRGTFVYAQSWLSHPARYSLDPVNLPLKATKFQCDHNQGVFPVFSDAAPDAWGTRILLMRHKAQPNSEVERLLLTSGRGVGSLQFSLSQSRPKAVSQSQDISLLTRLYRAAEALDGQGVADEEALRLMEPGSSMGGARPKASIEDNGQHYLAKFSKQTDLVDVPRVEFATMRLLARTELDVPLVRVEPVGRGRSAYLIERFDMAGDRKSHHYVSAHALFNIARHRELPDGRKDPAGYVALAKHIRSHSHESAKDTRQLFLRAFTNIALGNTDDHARNFGLRYDLCNRHWSLAPVFDVLPIVGATGQKQALSLGTHGREPSWENLLSCHRSFGLSDREAHAAGRAQLSVLANWSTVFADHGVSHTNVALLRTVIEPRLEGLDKAMTATASVDCGLSGYRLDDVGVAPNPAPKRSSTR
ncbi:type II toxin-antitoxin system HipA family toxin [Marinimicrobium sp. ABcell2]|uniref:type II toxin-antitoxin system HipA family toxin n=1 Tax=Marinimicrobium sp. ABcell2 TaxID=3069751 RepID=UPI0027B38C58|nr:type II toxin-antitoxin system HipA family toxin [Marinimicrobium sp. ABcell2]MDQ2077453.1 type II toxin-antitoxin system HipA family toxin [Marinimicrobium sp. ABcell2]